MSTSDVSKVFRANGVGSQRCRVVGCDSDTAGAVSIVVRGRADGPVLESRSRALCAIHLADLGRKALDLLP